MAQQSRVNRILLAQYLNATKNPHANLSVYMDPKNVKEWYFMIKNLDYPYDNGEYIFKLTAPKLFPSKPPRFEFMTENGVFIPGGPICISIGEYHSDTPSGINGSYGWRPALGMFGFAVQVVNGMICSEFMEGIRIIKTTLDRKVYLAVESKDWNSKNYPNIIDYLRSTD